MRTPAKVIGSMSLALGVMALAVGGGITAGQSLPAEEQLCVTVAGPAPSGGWTTESLSAVVVAGTVTIAAVDVAAACAPPASSPSPLASTSLLPSPSPVPSPGGATAPTAKWGPMAVVHDAAKQVLDARIGPGRLDIGDECVVLRGSSGSGTTLVWRDGQARWKDGTIVFRNADGTRLVLRDGDRLYLGGYSPSDIGGIPPLAPWVVMPNASCPAQQWQPHEVTRAH